MFLSQFLLQLLNLVLLILTLLLVERDLSLHLDQFFLDLLLDHLKVLNFLLVLLFELLVLVLDRLFLRFDV